MGIQSRVPAAEYHALPGVSITRLKELKRSPQHYRYSLNNPKLSKPMTLGTAAHCAVLEPERFSREFSVWARMSESGNQCPRRGQFWDAFLAENPGKTIITMEENANALAMAKAVRGNATAMKYLESGEPEVTMQWQMPLQIQPDNSITADCRGRADWLTIIEGKPYVVGLKTARDCRPIPFGNAAARLSYHMQWAFYHDGYRILKGIEPTMIEIVVESEPPHAVVTYFIPEDVLLQGRDEYLELMRQLVICERENYWPGPATEEQALSLPSWVYGDGNDDLSEIGLE